MTTDRNKGNDIVSEISGAIGTRVEVLEKEVGEINTRLASLDDKFDRVMSGFATEFRASIAGISTQFNAGQRTPWGVLMSAGSLILTIMVVVGGLAFAPLRGELNALQAEVVPRREYEARLSASTARTLSLEEAYRRDKDHHIERLERQVDQLKQYYWSKEGVSR